MEDFNMELMDVEAVGFEDDEVEKDDTEDVIIIENDEVEENDTDDVIIIENDVEEVDTVEAIVIEDDELEEDIQQERDKDRRVNSSEDKSNRSLPLKRPTLPVVQKETGIYKDWKDYVEKANLREEFRKGFSPTCTIGMVGVPCNLSEFELYRLIYPHIQNNLKVCLVHKKVNYSVLGCGVITFETKEKAVDFMKDKKGVLKYKDETIKLYYIQTTVKNGPLWKDNTHMELISKVPNTTVALWNLPTFVGIKELCNEFKKKKIKLDFCNVVHDDFVRKRYGFIGFSTQTEATNWLDNSKGTLLLFNYPVYAAYCDKGYHQDWICKCKKINFRKTAACDKCAAPRPNLVTLVGFDTKSNLATQLRHRKMLETQAKDCETSFAGSSEAGSVPSCTLLFKGLDERTVEKTLQQKVKEILSSPCKDFRIIRDPITNTSKSYAFGEMYSILQAELFLGRLSKDKSFDVDGKKVFVSYAKETLQSILASKKLPPAVVAETSTQNPASAAKTSTQKPTSTAKTSTQIAASTAKTSTQNPASTVKTTTQNPASTAKTSTQNPASTAKTSTQNPVSTAKTTTQSPAGSAKTSTKNPASTAPATSTQNPASAAKTSTQKPTSTAKTSTQIAASTAAISTQNPASTVKTTTQSPSSIAKTSTKNPASTAKTSTQNPVSTAKTTTQSPAGSAKTSTKNPASTAKTSTQNPVSTAKTTTQSPAGSAKTSTQNPASPATTATQNPASTAATSTQNSASAAKTSTQKPTSTAKTSTQIAASTAATSTQNSASTVKTTTQSPSSIAKTSTKNPASTAKTSTENPASTAKTSTKNPASTAKTSTENPASPATTTTQNPAGSAKTSTKNPASTAKTSTQNPASTAKTSTQIAASTAKTSTQNPASTVKTTTQNPASTAKTSIQNPVSTAKTTTQSPAGSAKTSTKNPASTAKTSTQNPASPATTATRNPASTAATSIQNPVRPAKLSTQNLASTVKTSTQKPASTAKTSTQNSASTAKSATHNSASKVTQNQMEKTATGAKPKLMDMKKTSVQSLNTPTQQDARKVEIGGKEQQKVTASSSVEEPGSGKRIPGAKAKAATEAAGSPAKKAKVGPEGLKPKPWVEERHRKQKGWTPLLDLLLIRYRRWLFDPYNNIFYDKSGPVKCPVPSCSNKKILFDWKSLQSHWERIHIPTIKVYLCSHGTCVSGMLFAGIQSFNNHLRSHTDIYQEDYKDYLENARPRLVKNKKYSDPGDNFLPPPKEVPRLAFDLPQTKCPVKGCGQLYTTCASFKEHWRKYHSVYVYRCSMCNTVEQDEKSMTLHMKTHGTEVQMEKVGLDSKLFIDPGDIIPVWFLYSDAYEDSDIKDPDEDSANPEFPGIEIPAIPNDQADICEFLQWSRNYMDSLNDAHKRAVAELQLLVTLNVKSSKKTPK